MKKMYNNTDNPKCKARHAVLPRDRHDASSRSGLLLRLFSAALALMLAVGGVSLLHLSFSEQLPVVQAANGEIIIEDAGSTWDSDVNMAPDQTTVQVVKIFLGATSTPSSDNGGSMIIRAGKTVEMVSDGGIIDSSVIQILQGASLHLHGAMTGHFDELTIANKESLMASRDGHFYIYLRDGATFTATYNSDMFTEGAAGVKSNKFECLGCNIGSNLENREKYPDVDFDKTTDMPVTSNIAMTLPDGSETNNVTDSFIGRFSLDDPGPIYTITANPMEGYSQVVWTKGPKGEVIETDSDLDHAADPNVVVNGNTVDIHLKEHVKYQVYATYIPDPVWTWDEDNNPTITVYSYDPEDENSDGEGIISQTYDTPVISDTVVDPAATCTEGGKTTYKAFVVVNGTTYRNDHTVDTEALGHDLRDDWFVTEEPTQTETGTKIRYCHRDGCTYSETAVIDKLGGGGNGDGNGDGNGGGDGNGDGNGNHSNVYDWDTGSQWEWTKGSTSKMTVILENVTGDDSKTFGKLQKVSIDGTVIYDIINNVSADGKFIASPGSIKFEFLPGYLDTLSVGNHRLKVELTDGTLENTFTIKASGNNNNNTGKDDDMGKGDWNPKTTDNHFRLFVAGWFCLASSGTIVMLLFHNRRKRYSHR